MRDVGVAAHGQPLAGAQQVDALHQLGQPVQGTQAGARQGLRLVSAPLVDPIDIRLRIGPSRRRPWLTGRSLCWAPATGWLITHRAGEPYAY
jgi:hypothetical protein